MSIINQMLKDLENRSKKRVAAAKNPADPVLTEYLLRKNRFRGLFLSLFLLAGIFLVLDLYFIFHHQIKRHAFQKSVAVEVSVVRPAVPAPPGMQSVEPVRLTGMTVDVQQGFTRLRFLLSQTVLYRISSDAGARSYLVTFDHTHPVASLPIFNYTGTAIDSLKLTPQPDGSLQIFMQLKQGARLQQAGIFSGTLPEFQMDLVYVPPVKPPAVAGQLPPPVLSQSVQLNDFTGQSLETAKKLVASGETEKAVVLLRSVLNIAPGFHPARETLIRLLMQHGRMDEAEDVLRAGLNRYPEWLAYIDLQARWLAEHGQTGAALTLLSQHTPAIDAHPDYYALMAALYQRQNQPQMASTLYRQLITVQPHNAKWWLGYAIGLDASDHHSEAMNAYTRALQEDGAGLSPELQAWIETRLHPG